MRVAGVVLGLCLADLGEEQLPAESAQLALVAFEPLRADDVGSRAGTLQHDGRLIGLASFVDDVRDALSQVGGLGLEEQSSLVNSLSRGCMYPSPRV